MNQLTVDALRERVDRLENGHRRLKGLAGVALLALAAVMVVGQAVANGSARVIEAEKFVLRDASGASRTELTVLPDGSPTLGFLDKDEKPRALLGLAPDGSPGLAFLDTNEKARLTLTFAGGAPAIAVIDKEGRVRAKLDVATDGVPGLAFLDQAGRPAALLGIMADGRLFLFPGGK